MAAITHVATITGGNEVYFTRLTDLVAVSGPGGSYLMASTMTGGGLSRFFIENASMPARLIGSQGYNNALTYIEPPRIVLVPSGAGSGVILTGMGGGGAGGYAFDDGFGTTGRFSLAAMGRDISAMVATQVGGNTLFVVAQNDQAGFSTWLRAPDGSTRKVSDIALPQIAGIRYAEVDFLRLAEAAGKTYVIAGSTAGNIINAYELRADGTLRQTGGIGHGNATGMFSPRDAVVVNVGAQTYVIVSGAESSSLTSFRFAPDGRLVPVDHVIDELTTRFQGVTAMTTVTVEGRSLLIVGGADDGISLFVVLPNGKLLYLDTIADNAAMSLADVSALSATVVDGKVVIFAGSSTEAGITQLVYDPGTVGETRGVPAGAYVAGPGDDIIVATPGTTSINGGAGNDTLVAGVDPVTLTGGAGADLYVLSSPRGRIIINGYDHRIDRIDLSHVEGLRSMYGVRVSQTATGATLRYGDTEVQIRSADGRPINPAHFTDSAFPTAHYDPRYLTTVIYGSDRGQRIQADPGGSVIFAGSGADTILGSLNGDWVSGGGGNDVILGRAGNDTLNGDDGHDSIDGMNGDDLIDGGAGNDTLRGGAGNDTIRGGAGNDLIYGSAGRDLLYGDDGADTIFGGPDADTIYGGAGNDFLRGDDGNDRIYGEGGNDRILGGLGDDWLHGGDGDDTVVGGPGNDTLYGGAGNDLLSSGFGDDLLDGGAGNDTLWGGPGNDRMFGGHGDDSLFGQDGDDLMSGGPGNDRLHGGNGADTIYGDAGNDTIMGNAGNDLLFGGDGHDRIFGNEGNDTIWGGTGNDFLLGNEGDDRIYGEDGDDTIFGGPGNDYLSGGAGHDRLIGGDGADTLFGDAGNDALFGEAGNDLLSGGSGNDSLYGGPGNDTLIGGMGADHLVGGPGADVFVFNSAAESSSAGGIDTIAGFERGIDRIDLSALDLRYIGTNDFSAAGQLRLEHLNGRSIAYADLNGDGTPDMVLVIVCSSRITGTDFIF